MKQCIHHHACMYAMHHQAETTNTSHSLKNTTEHSIPFLIRFTGSFHAATMKPICHQPDSLRIHHLNPSSSSSPLIIDPQPHTHFKPSSPPASYCLNNNNNRRRKKKLVFFFFFVIITMLTAAAAHSSSNRHHHHHHHGFDSQQKQQQQHSKSGGMDRKLQMQAMAHASKYLQRMIYPPLGGIQRTSSSLTLSSLSLSQNSNDSSLSSSNSSSWEPKVPLLYGGTFSPWGDVLVSLERRRPAKRNEEENDDDDEVSDRDEEFDCSEPGGLRRCSWITKNSDEAYVQFHDECWGVPVYSDNRLFELLALSGMLIDHSWTEILKRRDMYMEAFAGFDPMAVAKMEETDIAGISGNKELKLAECRVRCVVENAKCICKVAKEFGSFSEYIWGHMNHRPAVGKYRHHKYIPFRTPKAEAVSKDLVRRGFRLVGPVIVYSFMQASGMVIDHLLDCFRFHHCARLADR